jgi:hypothetical protein
VRIAAAALLALCALTACVSRTPTGSSPSPTSASPSPSVTTSPSGSPSATPSPGGEPFTTQLTCGRPVAATHGLALYALGTTPPILEILDVSDPLQPALLCRLSPAQGGSFDQASNQVVFWIGDQLGSADLTSGQVVQTARLPFSAFRGVFSPDGSTFAYRATIDTAGSISTRIDGGGYDRELYAQSPIGGHGGPGPGRGPFDLLAFSADGQELLDFNAFRQSSGPDIFLVYRTKGILGTYAPPDSFLIFQSTNALPAGWSPTGSTLYFFISSQQGPIGELDSLEAGGRQQTVAGGLTGVYWGRVAPSGASIVYDTYVSSPDDSCGGLPYVWTFELANLVASQQSAASSSDPAFVTRTVVWSNQETVGQCGPGGESYPDGVIIAHDINTGRNSVVDTTQIVPGIGGPPLSPPNTGQLLDVWF